MVPTKRFWALIAIGIPLAAVCMQAGVGFLAVIYNVILVGVAWISTRLVPSTRSLRITRKFDPVLSVRASNKVTVVIENDSTETIVGRLRDEPPPTFLADRKEFPIRLDGESDLSLTYHVTPQERGTDYFRGTFLRLECPFGLVHKQVKIPSEQPIRIYPNVLALREFDLLRQQGRLREMGIRRSRMRGLGMEFESLREYGEGDDFRKVDWKATARKGKLVVRQYEQERNQSVLICIDIGRHMLSEIDGVRKLDHALDACLMLTQAAAIAGDFVGLMVYADTVRRYIPPRKGRSQVGIIIEALHDLVAEPVESDATGAFAYLATRWKRRSLLVAFTDLEDQDRAKDLTTSLGPMAKRHLVLMARVLDARVKVSLAKQVQTKQDMYEKAAGILLQEDRKAAESVLTAARIHNIEAEHQDLAAALVSFYFMVKERSLL